MIQVGEGTRLHQRPYTKMIVDEHWPDSPLFFSFDFPEGNKAGCVLFLPVLLLGPHVKSNGHECSHIMKEDNFQVIRVSVIQSLKILFSFVHCPQLPELDSFLTRTT
ncbi:hypothetical protein HOLleu_43737 [Holothuria leucospilota]|uniref:Uncharacterized protein n=1 Tax=Holothuria leucospilota TaxID=206669 RepID=A0A9Q1BAW5_HOLLE|nr:hypothetical protein HOLleu_43737 [Holothuria leucospilota]